MFTITGTRVPVYLRTRVNVKCGLTVHFHYSCSDGGSNFKVGGVISKAADPTIIDERVQYVGFFDLKIICFGPF